MTYEENLKRMNCFIDGVVRNIQQHSDLSDEAKLSGVLTALRKVALTKPDIMAILCLCLLRLSKPTPELEHSLTE